MSLPNPPSNYSVTSSDGEKILSFTKEGANSLVNIKIYKNDILEFDGNTRASSINVPITITGYNKVEGTEESESGGWGPPNNPKVDVNFY